MLLPWLIYLGVTIVAPLARGAAAHPEFWPHALITLSVSGLIGLQYARDR